MVPENERSEKTTRISFRDWAALATLIVATVRLILEVVR